MRAVDSSDIFTSSSRAFAARTSRCLSNWARNSRTSAFTVVSCSAA